MAKKIGTSGRDILYGTNDGDVFNSYGGDDDLYGAGGDDIFFASAGYDRMAGGEGSDTVSYAGIAGTPDGLGVYVDLGYGRGGELLANGALVEFDTYNSIENVTGSNFSDVIIGDDNVNVLKGLDGRDVLSGGGGGDTILGGNGDDWIEGGSGRDVLDGGSGVDTVSYRNATSGVSVWFSDDGMSGLSGQASGDVLINFEAYEGSNHDDTFFGSDRSETISGLDGNDEILGRDGDDNLFGGNGADEIDGGWGSDMLIGGDGNDVMTGDYVGYGDSNTDFFVFHENTNSGKDVILDFDASHDRILFNVDDNSGSYSIKTSAVNAYTYTLDVTIDFENSGEVTLKNVSLFDLGNIEDAIILT